MPQGATTEPLPRSKAVLIAGGLYHDFDYARLALLDLLSDLPSVKTRVMSDYSSLESLSMTDCLISYTCNLIPDAAGVAALQQFLDRGGRWLALHGTNSILAQNESGRWFAPDDDTGFMRLLGSQFVAHPPIAAYDVNLVQPDDPLVAGLSDIKVAGGDELYYMRIFGDIEVILDATGQGAARGFVEREWPAQARHAVLYRKRVGAGEIVYFTLGHRRGHYDMDPLVDYYPTVEKGAWEDASYLEIMRRALKWAALGAA